MLYCNGNNQCLKSKYMMAKTVIHGKHFLILYFYYIHFFYVIKNVKSNSFGDFNEHKNAIADLKCFELWPTEFRNVSFLLLNQAYFYKISYFIIKRCMSISSTVCQLHISTQLLSSLSYTWICLQKNLTLFASIMSWLLRDF